MSETPLDARAQYYTDRIAELERELAEASDRVAWGAKHARLAGERIAALESTLREVRGLIEPYATSYFALKPNGPYQALALIDKELK